MGARCRLRNRTRWESCYVVSQEDSAQEEEFASKSFPFYIVTETYVSETPKCPCEVDILEAFYNSEVTDL